jgi:F-type H+-transporting ATPase subunit a
MDIQAINEIQHIAEQAVLAENKEKLQVKSEESPTLQAEVETGHKHTLFAEPVFIFKNFTITNSLLTSFIVVLLVFAFVAVLKFKIKQIPKGIQNMFEIIIDGALNLADSVTGDRQTSIRFFPIVFALFIFILLNNWLGLLPGVGSIGYYSLEEGHQVFVPFFRGGTADLNTTLALALFSVIGANLAGVIMVGFWRHFNKFINIKAFLEIPKKILKEPTILLVNPIKAFVGLVEIIGEFAKVASLSFRLFGNIFAGEVLLASMAALFAFLVPIPFLFLEIIVGLVQALIFAVLTLVYMTIATAKEEH